MNSIDKLISNLNKSKKMRSSALKVRIELLPGQVQVKQES